MKEVKKQEFFKRCWEGLEPSLPRNPRNRIVMEYDDVKREDGIILTRQHCNLLNIERISYFVYDHLGKSPHTNIEVEGIKNLNDKQLHLYKKKFLLKYCADEDKIDLSLATPRKLIAAPNYLHYKIKLEGKPYGVKELIDWKYFDVNKIDLEIVKEVNIELNPPENKNTNFRYDMDISEIASGLPGLKPRGNKLVGSHPIHGSTTGMNFEIDLSKNVWYCFRHASGGGCRELIAILNGIVECK